MLTELCKELNNWFDQNRIIGKFKIEDGELTGVSDMLQNGQYFRIVGSVFNDGVHVYPALNLKDEEFDGAVWAMAVPPSVIALSEEIDEWNAKYGGVDSQAMSPYYSESFGGYSYTKGGTSSNSGSGSSAETWQNMFAAKLNKYRRIRP